MSTPTVNLNVLFEQHLQFYRLQNYSQRTIEFKTNTIGRFLQWCQQRAVTQTDQLDVAVIEGFRRHLFHYRNPDTGKPLQFSTQSGYLIHLRLFCRWLVKCGYLIHDPSLELQIPKTPKHSLGDVLTIEEVETFLNAADVTRPLGIRDRAIVETFFSTAIRASELGALRPSDIDTTLGQVRVINGKGGKDRLVPIGREALDWIEKYTADVRPSFTSVQSHTPLFLNIHGKRLSRESLGAIVRRLLKEAGIERRGSCHLLRHTAATLMMENGADIRVLQTYLGHARLDTTQIYTHMTLGRLREVHAKTHPRGDARLNPKRQPPEQDSH